MYVAAEIDQPPSYFLEQEKFLQDLLLTDNYAPSEGNELITVNNGVKKRQRKASSSAAVQENMDEASNHTKKIMHRDIERQRRQEMSVLYASIRSLLPQEYTKGKRSASDHVGQAVNYVKHMQKKIEELKMRRDKLKRLSNSSGLADTYAEDQSSDLMSGSSNCVNVNGLQGGVEVLISSSLNQGDFPLSKAIAHLLGRGLNVISCVSAIANGESLHKIQIEVEDLTSINLAEIRERLAYVITTMA
ncbi:UNVERIFIED_CONTAM: Transcription factor [Sesamum angustifolium]|uniref:Transcription factor n=1 Tax=Sesamum angustifolium TaxID=2727405 RepID=A0AAW2LGE7_9LAMI